MPKWFERLLGALYPRIPAAMRPLLKQVFQWSQIRLAGLIHNRRVRQGVRVAFLDFEIAYLEPFEYLSPRPNEVEVLARCSTVSPGTERAVLCGLPGARRAFPYFPGYSCAGEIIGVGSKVTDYRAGDRVAGRIRHSSGDSVSTEFLFRIPEGVSFESASFIELGIIALQGIRKAAIRPGDTVAVLGQGLIGQLANRLARTVGAVNVIAIAPTRNRAATALAPGGATSFLTMADIEFDRSGVAADVVIEAVGTPDAVASAVRCVRHGGCVVLLGSARGLSRDVNLANLVQKRRLRIVGAHISDMPAVEASRGRHTYRQEGELFLDLLQSRRLTVESLITWRAAPDDCNAVYEALARGGHEHVGILFEWKRALARSN